MRVLEDGDLQTIGMMDYDKRLSHSFTAHPKVDPLTGMINECRYKHGSTINTLQDIFLSPVICDLIWG